MIEHPNFEKKTQNKIKMNNLRLLAVPWAEKSLNLNLVGKIAAKNYQAKVLFGLCNVLANGWTAVKDKHVKLKIIDIGKAAVTVRTRFESARLKGTKMHASQSLRRMQT